MAAPHELIERALSNYGSTLYRIALLLADNERDAEHLLVALVRDLLTRPSLSTPDDVELLARLRTIAHAHSARKNSPGKRSRPATTSRIYQRLTTLPFDQRLALGLHLLLGYDLVRLARVIACDEQTAQATMLAAGYTIAPAARISLTNQVCSDQCSTARDALIDPAGRLRHAPAIRGHLAACAHCRAFDRAWGELLPQVEEALRITLRARDLPARLATRLKAMSHPKSHFSPTLYMALPPLAILLIIAVLIVPGSIRQPVTVVNRAASTPVDPHALITHALEIQNRPPESDNPIWHAQYQTVWYFDDSTIAPLHADVWLDRSNPARHRTQLTHIDGGAPYELQLGDGDSKLYYALDALYAPILYADLQIIPDPGQPTLLNQLADREIQAKALERRLSFGVWNVPNFYLQQAQRATHLRMLGHQRTAGQDVQIISFSGQSALGYPSGVPGMSDKQATILLALDSADQRLRSITELASSPTGAQTSRIIWKLVDEQNFENDRTAGFPFDIRKAWNGRGTFDLPDAFAIISLDVPLVDYVNIGSRAQLEIRNGGYYLPSSAPAGISQAFVILQEEALLPNAVIYLGPDRRLILQFGNSNDDLVEEDDAGKDLGEDLHGQFGNSSGDLVEEEKLQITMWDVLLKPGHTRTYSARIKHLKPPRIYTNNFILIEAYGFSREEIVAVIESLHLVDEDLLDTQRQIFIE